MSSFEKVAAVFVGGLITITVLGVLVGPGKQTPGVINATGGALSGSLLAAQGK
jgi:hypothetical protein